MKLIILSTFLIFHVFATQPPPEGPSTFDQEKVKAQANAAALQSLHKLTRFASPDVRNFNISYVNDEPEKLLGYGIGLASLMAYGLVPAVFLLLFCLFWCPARACNCKCCGRCCVGKPRTHWGCLHRLLPLLSIAICGVVITTFSALAYVANGKFSNALFHENTGTWFVLKKDFVNGTGSFFEVISQEMNVIIDASAPNGTITQFASQLKDDHNGTITAGNRPIINAVSDFCEKWDTTIVNTQHPHEYPTAFPNNRNKILKPTYAMQTNGVCDAFRDEINGYGAEAWARFNDYMSALVRTMADTREVIYNKITEVNTNQVQYGVKTIDDFYAQLNNQEPMVLTIEENRRLAYVGIFAVPLLPVAMFVLCYFCGCFGCKKCTPCFFTLTYTLAWVISFLMFIILAIHLPIAAGLQDFCGFLDVSESNFEKAMSGGSWDEDNQTSVNSSTGSMGKMMDACLQDMNLAVAFNVEDQLEFGTAVEFPEVNVAEAFDFQVWGNMSAYRNKDYTDFDVYEPQATDSGLDSNCSDYFELFKNDIDAVDATILHVEHNATQIYKDMLSVEGEFTPILEAGRNIVSLLKCGYVGDLYWKVKTSMCQELLTSLAMMCAAMAVNGIMLVVLAIIGCKTRKQFKECEELVDLENNAESGIAV